MVDASKDAKNRHRGSRSKVSPQILVAQGCAQLCAPPRRNGVDAPVPGGNDFLGKSNAPYPETPVVTSRTPS
jgi:hypothetical protein